MSTAEEELKKKFGEWAVPFYGNLPFLFAYAAGGTIIQFYKLTRSGEHLAIFPDTLSADSMSSRWTIILALINMMRVMNTIRHLCPSHPPMLYEKQLRNGGVTVYITPLAVIKKIPSTWPFVELKYYQKAWNIYAMSRGGDPLYENGLTLKLFPVGSDVRHFREDPGEVRHATRDVLEGLSWLHSKGWTHRDLRWPNVIRDAEGSYRIIDFEHAGRINEVVTWPDGLPEAKLKVKNKDEDTDESGGGTFNIAKVNRIVNLTRRGPYLPEHDLSMPGGHDRRVWDRRYRLYEDAETDHNCHRGFTSSMVIPGAATIGEKWEQDN